MLNRPPTRIELKLEDDLIDFEETILYRKNLKDNNSHNIQEFDFSHNSHSGNKNVEIEPEMLQSEVKINNFNFTPKNIITNNLLQSGDNEVKKGISQDNYNYLNTAQEKNNYISNFSNLPQPNQFSSFTQISSNFNPSAPYYYSNDSCCISPNVRVANKSLNITKQNIISEFISEEGGDQEEHTEDEYLRRSRGSKKDSKNFISTPDVSMR
jgi:hypothetical protein